jgi:hypothetical protein
MKIDCLSISKEERERERREREKSNIDNYMVWQCAYIHGSKRLSIHYIRKFGLQQFLNPNLDHKALDQLAQ